MKRRKNSPKSLPPASTNRGPEDLLWIAEHGDVPSLDLHGLSTLTAEHELAQFIYDQSYRHTPVVCIIHGHGTGKLKQVVETWVHDHPELIIYARPSLGSRGGGAMLIVLK